MPRRVAKWGGIVICLLIAGLWIVSDRVAIVRRARAGKDSTYAAARAGMAVFLFEHRAASTARPRPTRWTFDPVERWPVEWPAWPEYDRDSSGNYRAVSLRVPLWLPLAAAALPSVWLWCLDRRRPRPMDCVACRYDLSGLAPSARCPECGSEAGPRIMPE